jgi:hypothetical protein
MRGYKSLEQAQVPVAAASATKPAEAQVGAVLEESGHNIGHTQ